MEGWSGCKLVAAWTTKLDNPATSTALPLALSSWMSICRSDIHSMTSRCMNTRNLRVSVGVLLQNPLSLMYNLAGEVELAS